jgi:hypothetical protein
LTEAGLLQLLAGLIIHQTGLDPTRSVWTGLRSRIGNARTQLLTWYFVARREGFDVPMTNDPSWLDRASAWWAKADRAHHHLRSLDRLVAEFRASEPYTVVPRPTDIPGRILGPDHPTVATYRNNLGLVMQDLGDPAGAKTQFKRALAITEASLGADTPQQAISENISTASADKVGP